jgi:sensor domain CHASE-containing protein/HAMP domain-containing protein
MLLQTRIKGALLGLLSIGVAWTAFIQYSVVYRGYARIEQTHAVEDVWRCVESIRREGYHLEVLANDWSAWDDMYRFMKERGEEFKTENLNLAAMQSANLNLVCLVDQSNSIVWYDAMDSLTKNHLTFRMFSQATLPQDHPFVAHPQEADAAQLLRTEHGVMLVAFRPILPTNRTGSPRGTVIMGRFFSDANVEKLAEQTHVTFMAWNPSAASLPDRIRGLLTETNVAKVLVKCNPEADVIEGYAIMPDLKGQPALVIEATIPRTITDLGQDSAWQACAWIIGAEVILSALLLGFLNRHVVWPILRLRRRITTLHPDRDASARTQVQRHDEIGALATAFNTILDDMAKGQPPSQAAASQPDQTQEEPRLARSSV